MKMRARGKILWLSAGVFLGGLCTYLCVGNFREAQAATADRYEDFVMVTGPVSLFPGITLEGVWLLDYRAGKLLGSVIDRNLGKITSWAEVDLVSEFGIAPKQNVHFMMSTGNISPGQAALYVAETTTGKFGIYTMGPRPDGKAGMIIRRHDLVLFRQPKG
jgi:hypothetical protein